MKDKLVDLMFTTKKNGKSITPKMIRKAIKVLRENKVPEPYYIKVENPKEGGDPLDGWKPIGDIIYKGDIRNV